MIVTVLDYWSPKDETVVTETGYRYRDMSSVVKYSKDISDETYNGLFEQFYKLNNKLRYCNGSYYTFQDKLMEFYYKEWLKSDDFKVNSFDLYYGNGVVD
jgi:hypothetical protein